MLDDKLVIWGGEFGRAVYCQGHLTATDYGRDHHGDHTKLTFQFQGEGS
jgi:hypothetical protein